MNKPDLAILSIDLPSQKTGGTLLNYEIIKALSKTHNIHLFFLNTEEKYPKPQEIEKVKKYITHLQIIDRKDKNCGKLKYQLLRILRLISFKPRQKTLINSKKSEQIILKHLQENGIKNVFFTSMWATVLVKNIKKLNAKTSALLVNVEHEIFPTKGINGLKKFYYFWEIIRTKSYEKKILKQIDKLAALTKKDADKLQELLNKKVETTPPLMEPIKIQRKPEKNTLLLTTNQSFEPNRVSNRWFFEKVWNLVDQEKILNITGLDYNDELKKIAEKNNNVNYLGFVSIEELNKLYQESEFVINPTITGSGFQIKTLDAIARNIPVISTDFSNHLGGIIQSSNDSKKLAELINNPQKNETNFDYQKFYQNNLSKLIDLIS